MRRADQRLRIVALSVGLSALGLAGCGDDDDEDVVITTGQLRVVHAAPGAPAVDLYLDGSAAPFATSLAYGETTPYVELAPASHAIDVRAAGSAATSAPLYTSPAVTVATNVRYTAVAAGNVASTDEDDAFRVLSFDEAFAVPAAGNARARAVHASFDAPTVDLNIGNDGGTPEIAGLSRFGSTSASGFDVPSATAVQIGVASEDDEALTAFTTPSLSDGSDVFLIATGLVSALPRETTGFSLLSVAPDSASSFVLQNPSLYAFHGSPDAGALDVFSGNLEVADDIEFGDLLRVQLPPGTYTLDFFAAEPGASTRPATDPLATAETPNLVAGQSYLAIAAGELTVAAPTFRMITVTEQFALNDQENARVRAIHASADTPTIDVGEVQTPGEMEQPPLFTELSFTDSTEAEGLSVPPAETLLGVAETGDSNTAAEFQVDPVANQRTFVIAAGSFEGGDNPLGLFAVDTTTTPWTVTALPPE